LCNPTAARATWGILARQTIIESAMDERTRLTAMVKAAG